MLGRREPGIYGSLTLESINTSLAELASELGVEVDFFQSNLEGALITTIQEAPQHVSGIVINPAAYGHTSIGLRDALKAVALPFVEVHISNTFARETFRHHSYISDIASGVVIGFGPRSYTIAFRALIDLLRNEQA